MAGRLRKAINHQRHAALLEAAKKSKEYAVDCDRATTEPSSGRDKNLPYPQKLFYRQPHRSGGRAINMPSGVLGLPATRGRLIRPLKYHDSMYLEMMEPHCLWVRLFDSYDRLLLDHADHQNMHTSQMIHLCTKLINHLNLISRTGELKVQEALGTLEGTIIAQLTPPLDGKTQYHSWNSQDPNYTVDVGAIAIIRQTRDGVFKGQLIDDFIGTTFQLQ